MAFNVGPLIRIAAAAAIGLDCAETAGIGHGLLPLGDSHMSQLAILFGISFCAAELGELVVRPLMRKLQRASRRAWERIKKRFGGK
jgi:hypothetical protein